jgi:hypothetical protein
MSASVEGLIKRRRNLGSKLSFIDIDIEVEAGSNRTQLVIDGWAVDKDIVVGFRVSARGEWERDVKGGGTDALTGRFCVQTDGITVLESANKEKNQWLLASEHEEWRRKIGAQCACSDPTCARMHASKEHWARRRQLKAEKTVLATTTTTTTTSTTTANDEEEENDYANEANHDDEEGNHPKESVAAKAKHNTIFAQFLIDTYGASYLRDNGGVVDVAGGRGVVGLSLLLEHDVPVTLVEPRPVKMNSTWRKRVRKWRRRQGMPEQPDNALLCPLDQITACFPLHNTQLGGGDYDDDDDDDDGGGGGGGGGGDDDDDNHDDENKEEKEGVCRRITDAIKNCALVVGMHPDQPTGPLIHAAALHGKPWAVVPCCVFARQFPRRVDSTGAPVALYVLYYTIVLPSFLV